MRVAIIGMGTAGVSVLRHLVKFEKFKQLDVDFYDNEVNMGQGKPFQDDSEDLLTNVPVSMISLNQDNINEFKEWYDAHDEYGYGKVEYLPRFVFGHYMKDYLNTFKSSFSNIHVITQEVTHMYIEEVNDAIIPRTINVCTGNDLSSCQKYDYVFLTIGTLSYNDPYNLKGKNHYIHSPYPANRTLDNVKETDQIAIIGSGLASLDVIRYAVNHHQKKPIVVASRSGKLPSVRGDMIDVTLQYVTTANFETIKQKNLGCVPLDEAITLFKKECESLNIPLQRLLKRRKYDSVRDLTYDLNHPKELGALQSLIEVIKENMDWIWNSFSHEDQERFIHKYQRYLVENSNPMPQETARLLLQEIKSGNIKIYSGLEDIRHYYGKFRLKFRNKDEAIKADVVINATGAKKHLSQLDDDDALLLDIANRQIIQSHPMGGIQIVPSSNEVISPLYGTLNNLRAIGQVTNGVNYYRNGIPSIVQQAVRSVQNLYDTLDDRDTLNKEHGHGPNIDQQVTSIESANEKKTKLENKKHKDKKDKKHKKDKKEKKKKKKKKSKKKKKE
ncbi:pyridine nucleotide-disulfide oxidoreductase [Staphylococcus hyicus]|uniref:FAD/NAD(P)-binding protein n=1 Tax=Staphylococcus hyicus TaxID=1284 RepID=UPI000D1E1449|nr:FAD/NAD(P)-binding protein [Staphylococcus hyicus]PTJ87171.1 pyridine nucleotide-disulfide oxidoreductase [Staphylococcus hyicus]